MNIQEVLYVRLTLHRNIGIFPHYSIKSITAIYELRLESFNLIIFILSGYDVTILRFLDLVDLKSGQDILGSLKREYT